MLDLLQYDPIILIIGMLFGALLGLEREWEQKPAGLRTHTFVAGAGVVLVLLGEVIIHQFRDDALAAVIEADPLRLLQAVVIGIGFIGAGAIAKGEGGTPQNLSTAASILFTSLVGVAVGLQYFSLAITMVVLGLFVNGVVGKIEKQVFFRRK